MKISIVVPAFNEERLLGASLAQITLAANSFEKIGWDVELIVCDNNSTDRTAEIARAAGATVVFEPVNQIARARNSGAAAATGDWLVFVDADSHPCPELFTDVAAEIQSGKCLAGGATIRLDEDHLYRRMHYAALEFCQPPPAIIGGLIYFLRGRRVSQGRRFQQRIVCGGGIRPDHPLKETGEGNMIKKSSILHRHPLLTSARKMRLYTAREHLRFILFAIFNKQRALGSREAAHLWYDGRR